MRFRSKKRGTRVKDRAKNGAIKRAGRGGKEISHAVKTKNPVPRSLLRTQTETLATQAKNLLVKPPLYKNLLSLKFGTGSYFLNSLKKFVYLDK